MPQIGGDDMVIVACRELKGSYKLYYRIAGMAHATSMAYTTYDVIISQRAVPLILLILPRSTAAAVVFGAIIHPLTQVLTKDSLAIYSPFYPRPGRLCIQNLQVLA